MWKVDMHNKDMVLPYMYHVHQRQREQLAVLLHEAIAQLDEYCKCHIDGDDEIRYSALLRAVLGIVEADHHRKYIPGEFVNGIAGLVKEDCTRWMRAAVRLHCWCIDYICADFQQCDRHMRRTGWIDE